MPSTSLHQLNADRGLSPPAKLAYLALNWLRNHWRPEAADTSLRRRVFPTGLSDANWARLEPGTTPSRRLSDLFWLALPWEAIARELGEIRVFDTGCGDGHYALKLDDYSGGRIAHYTGVDVRAHPAWEVLTARRPGTAFAQATSENLAAAIPADANLLITQSAVEHFDHDLGFFESLALHAQRRSASTLQVHLLPSRACLRLYLFHGVRQYVPRSLSRLSRPFRDFSEIHLFALGGRHCNALHWSRLTRPGLRRHRPRFESLVGPDYERELRAAIEADMRAPSEPSFYALVIHSRPRGHLFG